MSRFFAWYGVAQTALLPLFLAYRWLVPARAGLRFQWTFHRVLLALTLLLPVALLSPLPRALSPVAAGLSLAFAASPVRADAAPPALAYLPVALAGLSLLGLLVFLTRLFLQKGRERRIASVGTIRRFGRVRVVVSARAEIPFSSGLVRPVMFLPIAAGSLEERTVVSAHEAYHLRHCHPGWNLLEAAMVSFFWYNPLVHLLSWGGWRIRELLCDASMGQTFGAQRYGNVLVRAAEREAARRNWLDFASTWRRKGFLRERVRLLLDSPGRRLRPRARAVVVACICLAAMLLAVVAAVRSAASPAAGPAVEAFARNHIPQAVLAYYDDWNFVVLNSDPFEWHGLWAMLKRADNDPAALKLPNERQAKVAQALSRVANRTLLSTGLMPIEGFDELPITGEILRPLWAGLPDGKPGGMGSVSVAWDAGVQITVLAGPSSGPTLISKETLTTPLSAQQMAAIVAEAPHTSQITHVWMRVNGEWKVERSLAILIR